MPINITNINNFRFKKLKFSRINESDIIGLPPEQLRQKAIELRNNARGRYLTEEEKKQAQLIIAEAKKYPDCQDIIDEINSADAYYHTQNGPDNPTRYKPFFSGTVATKGCTLTTTLNAAHKSGYNITALDAYIKCVTEFGGPYEYGELESCIKLMPEMNWATDEKCLIAKLKLIQENKLEAKGLDKEEVKLLKKLRPDIADKIDEDGKLKEPVPDLFNEENKIKKLTYDFIYEHTRRRMSIFTKVGHGDGYAAGDEHALLITDVYKKSGKTFLIVQNPNSSYGPNKTYELEDFNNHLLYYYYPEKNY